MRYEDTWFNKHSMTMYGGGADFGRILWAHNYVEVMDGGFTPMNRKNIDGSIDVLGLQNVCRDADLHQQTILQRL